MNVLLFRGSKKIKFGMVALFKLMKTIICITKCTQWKLEISWLWVVLCTGQRFLGQIQRNTWQLRSQSPWCYDVILAWFRCAFLVDGKSKPPQHKHNRNKARRCHYQKYDDKISPSGILNGNDISLLMKLRISKKIFKVIYQFRIAHIN